VDYEKFCSEILESNPKIRFATVYDQWAERLGGGLRNGLTSLLSAHKESVRGPTWPLSPPPPGERRRAP